MRFFPNYSSNYYCPGCDNRIYAEDPIPEKYYHHDSLHTIFSGYSDSLGDLISQINDTIDIAKCENCKTIFWMLDLEKHREPKYIKSKENETTSESRKPIPPFSPIELTINDYFKVLKTFELNKENEYKIRLSILWAYNDRIRYYDKKKLYTNEKDYERWLDNALKLMNLLEETDDINKFILAELNRNLGRFDECIRIVSTIESNIYEKVKEVLIHECKMENKMFVRIGEFQLVIF
ncbi:MAG: hypothetical protein Q7U47_04445 [Paludibacter sp.]|nr:hypothetical protein [Paludibacter sp.]